MPPNIAWFIGFAVIVVLTAVLLFTIVFFLRRIRTLGRWQDIYLTLTYVFIAISFIPPFFANLLLVPIAGALGYYTEGLVWVAQVWRLYLIFIILNFLPLCAFSKATFRPNSKIATFITHGMMLISGVVVAIMFFTMNPITQWDDSTWIILYEYSGPTMNFLMVIPFFVTISWFTYETFLLYIREKRKETPNPVNLRRFLLLWLSSVFQIFTMILTFVVITLAGIVPPGSPYITLVDILRYFTSPAMMGGFVLTSAIGWIMPEFAQFGLKKQDSQVPET
ncbi:MAG: hypothetical protein ACFFBD_05420 [Candidatus Hodarchaeota archaeon]